MNSSSVDSNVFLPPWPWLLIPEPTECPEDVVNIGGVFRLESSCLQQHQKSEVISVWQSWAMKRNASGQSSHCFDGRSLGDLTRNWAAPWGGSASLASFAMCEPPGTVSSSGAAAGTIQALLICVATILASLLVKWLMLHLQILLSVKALGIASGGGGTGDKSWFKKGVAMTEMFSHCLRIHWEYNVKWLIWPKFLRGGQVYWFQMIHV